MIGKLKRVRLRDVWQHEALDFTRWLEENVEVLNDLLGLQLVSADREQKAGGFNVDLVAEDASGNPVVVENQLEKSDHDHLGKLITYLTAIDAKTAVWIVAEPKPEHVQAITWLNESATASFYMVKAEAVQIGDSPPAPLLTLIVGPSEEARQVGQRKKEFIERYAIRQQFWSALLEAAKPRTKLFSGISPSDSSWIGTGAGRSGLAYNFTVRQQDCAVELYIDRGKDSDEENRKIFARFLDDKETIERSFGGELEWDQVEGRRGCRIRSWVRTGGYRSPEGL